jgi:hypothetical protein
LAGKFGGKIHRENSREIRGKIRGISCRNCYFPALKSAFYSESEGKFFGQPLGLAEKRGT